jgi:hypothetical protein
VLPGPSVITTTNGDAGGDSATTTNDTRRQWTWSTPLLRWAAAWITVPFNGVAAPAVVPARPMPTAITAAMRTARILHSPEVPERRLWAPPML